MQHVFNSLSIQMSCFVVAYDLYAIFYGKYVCMLQTLVPSSKSTQFKNIFKSIFLGGGDGPQFIWNLRAQAQAASFTKGACGFHRG